MKISMLLALIPFNIIISLHAMENEVGTRWRNPKPIRPIIHEIIKDHADEMIKRD